MRKPPAYPIPDQMATYELLVRAREVEVNEALAAHAAAMEVVGVTDLLGALERRMAEHAARRSLAEFDGALDRIEAGTYGTCEQCACAIPHERLEAIPEVRLCNRCPRRRAGPLW